MFNVCNLLISGVVLAMVASGPTLAQAASETAAPVQPVQEDSASVSAIRLGIDTYRQSIDAADVAQGATLFQTTPATLFVHPRGTERGWSQIADNFYGKTIGDTFAQRTLKLTGTPEIHVYGKTAIAYFEWDFVATMRDGGKPLHSTGRETQTWIDLPQVGWRIVEVHYSGPPVTGAGQGF